MALTSSGSGASPRRGFNVSFVSLKPEYKIIRATATPTYPSTGKSVHLEAKRDNATVLEVTTSPRASNPAALRADELIFFPISTLNLESQILNNIENKIIYK